MEPPIVEDQRPTTITDLDVDSLVQCASYLDFQDISNMAMTCKFLKKAAYSDVIWQRLFREHWPQQILCSSSGVREAYLGRLTAVNQFKFSDPLYVYLCGNTRPCNHMFLDKNILIFSEGSSIQMAKFDRFFSGGIPLVTLGEHKARTTCMRVFSLNEASLFRSGTQSNEKVVITSSSDHSIRMWSEGSCQRSFRGHNGPVSTLSDKLLGDDGSGKLLASGGEDGTVRLWSFCSGRGQHALKATLYGHEKSIKLISVAGHKPSLLVSISNDSKVRVWDTNASSSSFRSSCCVGMTSVPGSPVGMKCHESLLYIAAGSSVSIIDLRTMAKVETAAVCQPKLQSFESMPSKSLICTGGVGKAMLWDIRRSQETPKPEPIAELDGHVGPVTLLHMDPYKVVTAGIEDTYTHVWETDTCAKINSLICYDPNIVDPVYGCTAMAINGCRGVIASSGGHISVLRILDFTNSAEPVSANEEVPASKFWSSQSYDRDDTESEDE